jgi:acetylornithine deacetylase
MTQTKTVSLQERIDEGRLARTLIDLIGIPSVNPFDGVVTGEHQGELAAARYLAERLEHLGWRCEISEYAAGRANVLCRAPTGAGDGRKAVMLAGHLDTVQVDGYLAPFQGRLVDGKIYGRGACDMKAAIACYIEIAEVLAEAGTTLAGPLLIAGVGDEEYRQTGAKALREALPPIELVVIGEPTELRICTAAKGLAAYTLTVEGEATHGSVPDAGRNAILRTGELLGAFTAHADALKGNAHPLLGPGVINVGTIEGGLKPNIVPSCCRVGFSRRLLPSETPDSARTQLLGDIEAVAGGRSDWSLSPDWWAVAPYENSDAPIVSAFQRAAGAAGLADVALSGFPASSDAAYFGAPVVILGPGSLDQAHSLDEWVELDEMMTAAAVYLRFVLDRLAGPDAAR